MEPKGLLDFVYDRQSADGENVKEFLDKINKVNGIGMLNEIRKAWLLRYNKFGVIQQNDELITLFEGNGLKAVASTNASHGYVYVAVWEE
jgi:hypothetical protein